MGYSIRTQQYRYTEWGRGVYGSELYDYQQDPAEFSNLAGNMDFEDTTRKMKLLLDKKLRSIHQPE